MKIHNGYRITEVPDGNVLNLIPLLHEAMLPAYEDLYFKTVATIAAHSVDAATFGFDHVEGNTMPDPFLSPERPLGSAAKFLKLSSAAVLFGIRKRKFDLNAQVTFLPDPEVPGDVYALLTTEQPALLDAWRAVSWVTPFPYWDSPDRADGVSEQEWKERRDVWDRVLGWDVPVFRGLTWSLFDVQSGTVCSVEGNVERVVASLPSRSERALWVAATMPGGPRREAETYQELQDAIERLAAELEVQLPELTAEVLLGDDG